MKQKLIDANKAKVILWGYSRYTGIDEAPYSYAEEAIDILPTVKAIPIEWIEEYAEKMPKFDEVVYDMLKDWRKENE